MKKKILLASAVFFTVISLASYLKVQAGTGENVTGWLWGGSEEAADGTINGNETGAGWISMNNLNPGAGGSVSYGVNVPLTDGNLSGYGWSENIGWASFNAADVSGCPSGTCTARRVGNQLKGWARIMSIPQAGANAGGWSGWIKLGSEAGDPVTYGVSINPATGYLSGYAWSGGNTGPELGWVDFSRAVISVPKVLNATLSAIPDYCYECASLNPTLTAAREASSTTTGNITYEFDCIYNPPFSADAAYGPTANTTQSHNGCSYTDYATAAVRVTQEGVSAIATASIAVARCGNGIVEGVEQCDTGASNGACPATCSSSCATNNCSGKPWIEVAP